MDYSPIYKSGQVIIGTGAPVVVTGWTVKAVVTKRLNPEDYAVVGQLYSPTRGINLLVRNLLANPQVCHVVALCGTQEDRNSGAVFCLKDFFTQGVTPGQNDTGADCWVIRSGVGGFIDLDIPLADLELLRRSVVLHWTETLDDCIDAIKRCPQPQQPWSEPKTYPMHSPESPVLPGPLYGHRIEGQTVAETWVKLIHRIRSTGTLRPTGYDGQWQELIDLVAIVTDEPEGFHFPSPNYLPVTPEFMEGYLPQILDDAPVVEGVKYTYGQRLRSWFGRDQVQQIIDKLRSEIDAASAVANLWDPLDHERGGSPCLNHIWVRVVDGELSLTATFRSNDMFSAWPSNAMGLRALQRHIRDGVDPGLCLGPLITISQSAHIYDDCWENADRLIAQQYQKQRPCYDDPVGNFLIESDGKTLTVTQTTPGPGCPVKVFAGKNPLELVRAIALSSPALQPAHAGYLGMELQRAYSQGSGYEQDRKL